MLRNRNLEVDLLFFKVGFFFSLFVPIRTQEEGGARVTRRGQGNFKLAANFGYGSRGSADPRESLRKRRILKLALTAHKVSKPPDLCLPPAEHPDGQTSRSLVFSLTNN